MTASDRRIRRRHGALVASLLVHGLTLLALIFLLRHVILPSPPAEPSIAVVFAPIPAHIDAPPIPAPSPPAEPPPAVATAPPAVEPLPAPPPVEPEPSREEAAPAIPQPPPVEHPAQRRVATARPSIPATRPAVVPVPTTPAAVDAPLLVPAHPVAGMASDRPPVYPEIARRRGQQGHVVLHVNVSPEGLPVAVTVAESSGFPSLDAAALTAVQQWRFVPATKGGVPVPAVAEVPVRFRLTN
jgi:periplasmic protein TonB